MTFINIDAKKPSDATVKAMLADADLDAKVITAVEALLADGVQAATLVKALQQSMK